MNEKKQNYTSKYKVQNYQNTTIPKIDKDKMKSKKDSGKKNLNESLNISKKQ